MPAMRHSRESSDTHKYFPNWRSIIFFFENFAALSHLATLAAAAKYVQQLDKQQAQQQ